MTNEYAAEVAAGEAWLDENQPGWIKVFQADKAAGLHMEDCSRCVLGYVLGSYWDENSPVYQLGGRRPFVLGALTTDEIENNERRLSDAAAPLGFTLPRTPFLDGLDDWEITYEWELLGEAWTELIEKRLAEAGLLAD